MNSQNPLTLEEFVPYWTSRNLVDDMVKDGALKKVEGDEMILQYNGCQIDFEYHSGRSGGDLRVKINGGREEAYQIVNAMKNAIERYNPEYCDPKGFMKVRRESKLSEDEKAFYEAYIFNPN